MWSSAWGFWSSSWSTCWFDVEPDGLLYHIGAELGMSDGAARIAAHRLRARYRELLREEVGRTTDEPTAIDSEIADLIAALASH
jgi:hypothetical protein